MWIHHSLWVGVLFRCLFLTIRKAISSVSPPPLLTLKDSCENPWVRVSVPVVTLAVIPASVSQ